MPRSRFSAAFVLAVGAALSAPAAAQQQGDTPLTVSPSGGGASTVSPRGGGGATGGATGGAPAGEGAPSEGVYYTDEEPGTGDDDQAGVHHLGVVPEVHVVRSGDTLWDICSYYFNNPWEWPKVWSYNPTITNPHWIYPGDLVRLYAAGATVEPVEPIEPIEPTEPTPTPTARRARTVELRQLAFVSLDDLKFAGTIVGAPEEKELLSSGDEVYIEYPAGKPPQVKKRYAIYTETKQVKHPEGGAAVGAYVLLRGEVEIIEVKKGKKARGVITYVTDVVERGMRVGTMKTQFREVAPRASDIDLEGVVVAVIGIDELIGDNHVVFIDRGSDDGVKVGHQFRIVRRGDAYAPNLGPTGGAGRDDQDYPEDVLAIVIVVEVAKKTAVGMVIEARQEIEIGDHAVIRKPKRSQ